MKSVITCTSVAAAAILLSAVACSDSTNAGGSPDASAVDAGPGEAGEPVANCPAPTGGPTTHTGDVKGEETWTAAGSPHIIEGDVNVRDGAKLTIEPCAEVLLMQDKQLRIAFPGTPNIGGTLIAEGTADRPIHFAGKDGASWGGIYLNGPGTARLAYVTLEGGGGADFQDHATIDVLGDAVLPADPLLSVDHVIIKKSAGTGILMEHGSTFIAGSHDLTITASGSDEFPFPLEIEEHAIDALPSGTYTGNKTDEILLRTSGYGVAGGGLAVDATLHDRGVPYRMGTTKLDTFIIGGADGTLSTLTIEAGVTMKFAKETRFDVQLFTNDKPSTGAIRALGTADKPIVFTSASATPAAGDWSGLWFGGVPSANNQLDHVRIEYAGFDCGCVLATCSNNVTEYEGAVVFTQQPPSAFITNSLFKEIAGHGITEGFDGSLVNFRPTNTFEGVTQCVQTLPRPPGGPCIDPEPACDGM